MKKALLLLLLLCGINLHAQIVITQAEMPASGNELYRTRANNNPFLNYAATGPNHVWNYTNLIAANQDSAIYQTVASTNFVYALVYADIFFNPNRANHARAGVDIPFSNLLQLDNPYTFFYRSASVYKKVGYGAEIAGIPVPITYSSHDEIYSLPLQYGDTDSTFSSYNVNIPTLAYYGYEQSRLNNVDGWGSISTPHGTYDVIRVKTTLIGKDTVQIDTLSLGFTIDRPIVNEYKWLANGIKTPVMQVNTSTVFGIEVITDIFFYDDPRSITIDAPLASSFCPGQQIQLSYTATGTFNPGGFLSAPNVFRAQLSNASGSFATPVNIGSLTSQVSGIINATIPVNTPPGNGYRIRIIATNPAFTGSDNGFDITIGELPIATASVNGATTFCAGDSVVLLSGTNQGYSYQWQQNGIDISGATDAILTVQATGNYSVVVTNACGVSTSGIVNVTVNDLPEHTLPQTIYNSCNGAQVNIIATNISGQSLLSYQWFLDGNILSGENNIDINTNTIGSYTLQVVNGTTGCTYNSAAATLNIDTVINPVLTTSGNTIFCDGDSVLISIAPDPAVTYQWLQDGLPIPGATTNEVQAFVSGDYSVIATGANGCSASSLQSVTVTVNALPATPTVNSNGPTTFCDGSNVILEFTEIPSETYEWFVDGNLISGNTSGTYTATVSGNYYVVATSANGCVGPASVPVTVLVNNLPLFPVISSSGLTTFCDGDSVELSFVADPLISYQWTLNSSAISGAVSSTIWATTAGFYGVTATDINGCSSSANPETEVIVNPIPTQPVISANGNTTFCQGGQITLEISSQNDVTFQWYVDGNIIPGATDTFLVVTSSGVYSVMPISIAGCTGSISNDVTIQVNDLPVAAILTANGVTSFCDGGAVILEFVPDPANSYQWTNGGVNISGQVGSTLLVNTSGSYGVVTTSPDGCTAISSPEIVVQVEPLPVAPVITSTTSTTFCQGENVTLEFVDTPGVTYQWQLNGIDIPGATNTSINVADGGNYSVVATSAAGCTSVSVPGVDVIVNPLPAVPVITQVIDTLFASGSGPFQWFLNGVALPGETNSQLIITTNGDYTVVVTDLNGCSNVSTIYSVTNVGLAQVNQFEVGIYPNPSVGIYNISCSAGDRNIEWKVTDLAGKVIQQGVETNSKFTIDLTNNAAAIYIVKLKTLNRSGSFKLVKE